MDREELMQMSARKAVGELEWESIEFLFRPSNGLELLLRIDFEGMSKKIYDWFTDDSPGAMPHRFRQPFLSQLLDAIRREEFYQRMVGCRGRD